VIDLNIADANLWVDARCAQTDPELFFDLRTEKAAVEICVDCPLMQMCADYALKNEIEHGVWGGLTERNRKTIRKNIAKQKKRK
jgi:WhiB family redox-sensing transcriptional regulator